MIKRFAVLALALGLFQVALAGENRRGFTVHLTDANGDYVGVANVWPETWRGEELTGYTVRFPADTRMIEYRSNSAEFVAVEISSDGVVSFSSISVTEVEEVRRSVGGQFASGLRGRIEKFNYRDGQPETNVLVFRRADGTIVTARTIDTVEGWNRSGKKWRYEIRYAAGNNNLSGTIINAAELEPQLRAGTAFIRSVGNACKALALRDTADGPNNGKFLDVIPGVLEGNPRRAGESYCAYYAPASPFLSGSEGGSNRLLTRYRRGQ